MATLKACVQKMRNDGFYPVYIRVTHNRTTQYIKTDKMVTRRDLSKSMDISDPVVMKYCTTMILDYMEKLNRVDIHNWSARMIVDYLKKGDEDLCFSDYARKHIDRLIDNGQERNARNYELALQHMERFFGTTKVKFSQLTSANMARWIKSLERTARAKEMYPVCMRQVFRAAITEMNDYDTGMIRIKTNPWVKVKIPHADLPEKRAVKSFLNSSGENVTYFASVMVKKGEMEVVTTNHFKKYKDIRKMLKEGKLCFSSISPSGAQTEQTPASVSVTTSRTNPGVEEVYTRPAVGSETDTDTSGVNRGQSEGATATAGILLRLLATNVAKFLEPTKQNLKKSAAKARLFHLKPLIMILK